MSEFVKAFEKFLSRDLTYVFGGAVALWSFQYWRHASVSVPSTLDPQLVLLLAVCYVIGYLIQEVATLCRCVKTKASRPPGKLVQWVYRWYERKDRGWQPSQSDYEAAKLWLYDVKTPQRFRDDHERTESLKQLGTTLGPSFFVSGVLMWRANPTACATRCEVDALVAGLVLFSGLTVGLLGWLKVTQQREHLLARYEAQLKRAASE
jgi:hypothetical protein